MKPIPLKLAASLFLVALSAAAVVAALGEPPLAVLLTAALFLSSVVYLARPRVTHLPVMVGLLITSGIQLLQPDIPEGEGLRLAIRGFTNALAYISGIVAVLHAGIVLLILRHGRDQRTTPLSDH
jgi:hypothetical protein